MGYYLAQKKKTGGIDMCTLSELLPIIGKINQAKNHSDLLRNFEREEILIFTEVVKLGRDYVSKISDEEISSYRNDDNQPIAGEDISTQRKTLRELIDGTAKHAVQLASKSPTPSAIGDSAPGVLSAVCGLCKVLGC